MQRQRHPASQHDWQQNFLKMLPKIESLASRAFRHCNPELREELIAQVTADAFTAYRRLVELGREVEAFPSVLARFAIRKVGCGVQVGTARNQYDLPPPRLTCIHGVVVQPRVPVVGFDAVRRPKFNLQRNSEADGGYEMTTHLEELARQVRGHTIELLQAAPDDWLLWAPEGTSNHALWHAGHALWLGDALGIQVLTGTSELPAGWERIFGSKCRPVQSTTQWPSRNDVVLLLQRQLVRLLETYRDQADRLADGNVASRVIHGLHDEARHSGEMYLLLKLRRARIA